MNAPRGPNQPFDNTTAFYWGWFPRGRSGPWRVSLLRRALSWPWVEGSATALRSPSLSRTAANFGKFIWTRKLIHTYTTKSVRLSMCHLGVQERLSRSTDFTNFNYKVNYDYGYDFK